MVVGAVGSGKSSLLSALLGEMQLVQVSTAEEPISRCMQEYGGRVLPICHVTTSV